jgi:hypothetical protein
MKRVNSVFVMFICVTLILSSCSLKISIEPNSDANTDNTKITLDLPQESTANQIPGDIELSPEQVYQRCSPAVFFIQVYDERMTQIASGSGFFVSSDGLGVTNAHVLTDGSYASITVSDTGKTYNISACHMDRQFDWATIKVDGEGFPFLKIGDANTVKSGATVYTIGSPLGLQNTFSSGIVSNSSRSIDGINYIQISAPISHGSSGGALLNKEGEVIGITSASFSEGQNLNLAIPMTYIDLGKEPILSLFTLAQIRAEMLPYNYLYLFVKRYGTEIQDEFDSSATHCLTLYEYNEPPYDKIQLIIGLVEPSTPYIIIRFLRSDSSHYIIGQFNITGPYLVAVLDKNRKVLTYGDAEITPATYTYDQELQLTIKKYYSKEWSDYLRRYYSADVVHDCIITLSWYLKKNQLLISIKDLGYTNIE